MGTTVNLLVEETEEAALYIQQIETERPLSVRPRCRGQGSTEQMVLLSSPNQCVHTHQHCFHKLLEYSFEQLEMGWAGCFDHSASQLVE